MAISLITAVPGGGKTIYAVWYIIKQAIEQGRTVYTAGIPDLQIPTISLSYGQLKQWHESQQIEIANPSGIPVPDDEIPRELLNIKEGSLIVIDEVQYLWPAAGSKDPPEHIKYLTKHRHHGLEFVLITQSPQLVHRHVLAVVDKHIHIRKTWAGRQLFEWPEYCANVRAVSSRMSAIKRSYKLPVRAYGLYRSASKHVKQRMTVPAIVYAFPVILAVTGYMFYSGYGKIQAKTEQTARVMKGEEDLFMPDMPDRHGEHSAPAASSSPDILVNSTQYLYQVSSTVDWSKVSACIASASKCICYGHSSERLSIDPASCRKAVTAGWPGRSRQQPIS